MLNPFMRHDDLVRMINLVRKGILKGKDVKLSQCVPDAIELQKERNDTDIAPFR